MSGRALGRALRLCLGLGHGLRHALGRALRLCLGLGHGLRHALGHGLRLCFGLGLSALLGRGLGYALGRGWRLCLGLGHGLQRALRRALRLCLGLGLVLGLSGGLGAVYADHLVTDLALTGTAREDQRLTIAGSGFDDGHSPAGALVYEWARSSDGDGDDFAVIAGATERRYRLTQADVGRRVRGSVLYTNTDGTANSRVAGISAPVANVNDRTTGNVRITGDYIQGGILTADTSAIMDEDGLGTFTYQWSTGTGGFIDGATGKTYIPTQNEVGEIMFLDTFHTDAQGTRQQTLFSITIPPTPIANINDLPTGLAISGGLLVGQTLRADTSALVDIDGLPAESEFSYQWRADGADIANATGPEYPLTAAQIGAQISLNLRYRDAFEADESITSPARGPVRGSGDNAAPTSSGLTVTTDEDTDYTFAVADFSFDDGDDDDSLQAVRIDSLPAASLGELTLNGAALSAGQVIASGAIANLVFTPALNASGSASFTYSVSDGVVFSTPPATATVTVDAVNDAPSGTVTIDGTPTQGQTLTANTGGISDADGPGNLSFTYQWNTHAGGVDTAISGETSASYTLSANDAGDQISVSVRYTDAENNAEGPLTSAPTAAVVGPDLSGTTTRLTVVPGGDAVVMFPDISVRGTPNTIRIRVLNPDALDDGDTTALGTGSRTGYTVFFGTGAGAGSGTPHLLFSATANTSGASEPDRWHDLLRHITFAAPSGTGGRQLQLIADVSFDGTAYTSSTLTRTLNISANNAPTSSGLTATLDEDTTHTFAADQFGFDDADSGDTLTAVRIDSLPAPASLGVLALNGTAVIVGQVIGVGDIGTLVYTPVANANGEATFTFSVSDGTDFSTPPATATLTVTAVNDAPSGTVTIGGTPRVGATLTAETGGISDADGPDSLEFTYQWNTHSGGTDTAISGADSATYTLSAGDLGDQITVSVRYTDAEFTPQSLTSAPTVAVTAASTPNNPPTSSGLTATLDEDDSHTFAADQFGFDDADTGDTLQQVRIDTLPASTSGNLTLSGTAVIVAQVIPVAGIPNLVYTPVANANGEATFTFSVSDGTDFSTTPATATLTVTAVNDDPTGLPTISGTPREGATLMADTSGISDADGPASLTFTYQWNTHASGTNTAISGETAATYLLTADEVGDQITVSVRYTDAGGTNEGPLTSAPTTAVTAASTPNNPPTSTGLTATLDEDDSHTFAADQFGFDDADTGDTLQQVRIDTLPASTSGNLTLSGTAVIVAQVIGVGDIGTLVYTPVANVNGTANFTFSVSDGTDFSTATGTATLTVDAINDAPSGSVIIDGTPTVGETLTANTSGISDADGPASASLRMT